MGIVKNNNVMATTTGRVGQVYFRYVRGKQIVCALPGPRTKQSPNQLKNQKAFGDKSREAKELLKDPVVKAKYKARTDDRKFTAHMVAQSELMGKLQIEQVSVSKYEGKAGDEILVFSALELTKVIVTIVNKSGFVVESGDAARRSDPVYNWCYKTTVDNPEIEGSVVKVIGIDLNGNAGNRQQRIQLVTQ